MTRWRGCPAWPRSSRAAPNVDLGCSVDVPPDRTRKHGVRSPLRRMVKGEDFQHFTSVAHRTTLSL